MYNDTLGREERYDLHGNPYMYYEIWNPGYAISGSSTPKYALADDKADVMTMVEVMNKYLFDYLRKDKRPLAYLVVDTLRQSTSTATTPPEKYLKYLTTVCIGRIEELKHLKERAKKEELSNVYFLPRKPEREIPRYLCSATCGILILEENILSKIVLPQKMQMYMACKLPILCVMNGEAKKITEEAGAGYYVEADANKISEKIFEIINDENREEKGNNGRKYFEENFNKDKLIDTLSDILQEEVSKK